LHSDVINGAAIAAAIALDIPTLNTGELNPYLAVSAFIGKNS
jgi:hypothetical protein